MDKELMPASLPAYAIAAERLPLRSSGRRPSRSIRCRHALRLLFHAGDRRYCGCAKWPRMATFGRFFRL